MSDISSSPNAEAPPSGPRLLTPAIEALGGRLDKVLADLCPDLSRARVQSLIAEGRIRLERAPGTTIRDGNYRVKSGDCFILDLPEAAPAAPMAQGINLNVVFEDPHLIVIDKPAGMVVHPAPGHADGTLVNALLAHCGASLAGIGGIKRPGIVHRIDKDTSGLLVVAKTDAAMKGLVDLFTRHDLTRAYEALVRGALHPPTGTIDLSIGRSSTNRQKMAVVVTGGRESRTHYRTLNTFGPAERPLAAHMRLELETGRTHQIRVHLAHLGHPVLGDPLYGKAKRLVSGGAEIKAAVESFPRQALHAAHLGFKHPITRKILKFDSPLPDDMAALLASLTRHAGSIG